MAPANANDHHRKEDHKQSSAFPVLMISTDCKLFEVGSAVRERIAEYGSLFEELHVIVFSLAKNGFRRAKVAENVWLHPTSSRFKASVCIGALKIVWGLRKRLGGRKGNGGKRVVVSSQDPFETGLVGFAAAFFLRAALQVQVHTDIGSPYFSSSLKNRIRLGVASFVLPRAAAVRAVSERVRRDLIDRFRVDPAKIVVLPIFVDAGRIINQERKFNLRDRLPLARFLILMASRLTREKNVGLALEILKEVMATYPFTSLVVVGEGPERPALIRKTRELGIDQNVVFLPWIPDVISCMKSANVFLSTSLYEGYGLTLIEAGLAGCPVVSSSVGAVGEWLESGRHALVCPVNDKKCFVEAIKRLIKDNELRQNLKTRLRWHLEHSLPSKKKYLANFRRSFERCFDSKIH